MADTELKPCPECGGEYDVQMGATIHGNSCVAIAAYEQARPAGEPVLYQTRMRPKWERQELWTQWAECNVSTCERVRSSPELDDWIWEARALYATPQPAPVTDAVERRRHGQYVTAVTNLTLALGAAREALKFYAEHVGNCRKNTDEGNASRAKLDADCGKRAVAALTSPTAPAEDEREKIVEECAKVAEAEIVQIYDDSPEVDAICNRVVRQIAANVRHLSTKGAG